MNKNIKKGNSDIKSRMLPSLLTSLALPLTLFVFGPFELYANNMDEFPFGLWDFFGTFIAISIAIAAAVMLILIWLPKKAYLITCVSLALVSIMFYVQGTFLIIGMTSVEGDGVGDASVSTLKLVINIIVWVLVIGGGIAATVIFLKKRGEIISTVMTVAMITVIGMQLVSFVTVAVTTEGVWTSGASVSEDGEQVEALTYSGLEKTASGKNIVYFVVDRFSSGNVDDANRKCPEVFDELEGFTYYDEMVSLYPRTYPAVTYMMTGVENDFSTSRSDYFKNAWEKSDFLHILKDEGYSVNIYTEDYYAYEDSVPGGVAQYIDNRSGKTEIIVSDKKGLAANMTRLSLYRYLPFVARSSVGNITSDTFKENVEILSNNDAEAYTPDMKDAYNYLKEHSMSVEKGEKRFSFIHIQGVHLPNKYDADFNIAEKKDEWSVTDAMIQSFKIINLYIEQMKELGVYENSTIIIAGDHASIGSDSKDPYYAHLTALFVKPSGVGEGEIKVSSAPVAQEDIHATILDSEGIENTLDYGTSVFDIGEDDERERRYYFQRYIKDDKTYEVVKYRIKGSAKIFENWEITDRIKLDKSIYK